MSVPPDVPANVPADIPAPTHRGRVGKTCQRNDGSSPYLSGTPSDWRFQMRVPTALLGDDFGLVGPPHILRVTLGPRSRGEAR